MNQDELPLLLSVDQASAKCGLSRTVFYSKLMRGEIVSIVVGRRRYVPRHALTDYIDRLIAEQSEEARA